MVQKREGQSSTKERRTIRRSDEFKAKLSEASTLLAAKMEEKRRVWDLK